MFLHFFFRDPTCLLPFHCRYDVDGSGSIDLEEMRFVLADLGKLDGIPSSKVGTYLEVRSRRGGLGKLRKRKASHVGQVTD